MKVGGRLSLPPEGTNFCIPEIVESDLDTLSGGDDTMYNRAGSNLSNSRLYQAKSIPSLVSPQSPLEGSSGEYLVVVVVVVDWLLNIHILTPNLSPSEQLRYRGLKSSNRDSIRW